MRSLTIVISLLLIVGSLLFGCKAMEVITKAGTTVGVATGTISSQQADSINKSSSAVGKAMEKLTPENEYYIGRAVAATLLQTNKPYDNPALNRYLNLLGQSLAAVSDKPETFGGYHFLAMDNDEINAFAAPGGLILVSRGLLRCCKNEDALAAVLAHEVGHIQGEHAINAIKKSRLTSVFTVLATEAGKSLAGEQVAQLTSALEGSISDITSTLVNSGYARKFEYEADAAAVTIMQRLGYNPTGLKDMLTEMGLRIKEHKSGFAKTHPDPQDRIGKIDSLIDGAGPVVSPKSRQARFEKAMKGI
jgi:predicted Zn-dependent protease